MTARRTTLTLAALTAVLSISDTLQAQQVSDDLVLWPSPPDSLLHHAEEDDENMHVFREQASFVVPPLTSSVGPIYVDIDTALTSNLIFDNDNDLLDLQDSALTPGEALDVWMFHQDTHGETTGNESRITGSIDFGSEIVAIQTRDLRLNSFDDVFGTGNPTNYPTGFSRRGAEIGSIDEIVISSDLQSMTVTLRTKQRIDQLRVFTRPVQSEFELFCFGVGGACPCNNNAASNEVTGCRNSTNTGGHLSWHGSSSATPQTPEEDLDLLVSGLPTQTFGIVFVGTSMSAPGSPFGDGVLCVQPGPTGQPGDQGWGQGFQRLPVRFTGVSGAFSVDDVVSQLPAIAPGTTLYFQGYYRDQALASCSTPRRYNLTNALGVTFN